MSPLVPGRQDPLWDELVGRDAEKAVLDEALQRAVGGRSSVLVVSGEPGLGKSALIDAFGGHARPHRIVRASGVESDMELAFAGVHQLCLPLIDDLAALPGPQQAALRVVFGLSDGDAPDRFLVGLAVLSLLAQAASEEPLVCLLDDVQWLDRISALVIAFVARRLDSESIAMVLGTREVGVDLSGLDRVELQALPKRESRLLLDRTLPLDVDERVRDQIVVEVGGSPLGLVELPREIAADELAGGFGLSAALARGRRPGDIYRRRFEDLSPAGRQVVVLAAADPTGDVALLRRAALALDPAVLLEDSDDAGGLLDIGTRVRFRHPLARSTAYALATASEVRDAHTALALATDADADPDRRAWHRALSTDGPDEAVAAELERSADRALARGGLSAAAAFLERSATLSVDPLERARRALSAAQARRQSGDPDAALDLVDQATSGPIREDDAALAEVLRAQLRAAVSLGGDLPRQLLDVAGRLAALGSPYTAMAHMDAVYASMWADRYAPEDAGLTATLQAALAVGGKAPGGGEDRLAGLAVTGPEDLRPQVRMMLELVQRGGDPATFPDGGPRWYALAALTCNAAWDNRLWRAVGEEGLALHRRLGAVTDLPTSLNGLMFLSVIEGDLDRADVLRREVVTLSEALGNPPSPAEQATLAIAAHRGDVDTVERLYDASLRAAHERGEGAGVNVLTWARSVLDNGLGHYESAAEAVGATVSGDGNLFIRKNALVEAVEALSRVGRPGEAQARLDQLEQTVAGCTSDWGLGLLARSRALLTTDPDRADALYREAIERLERAGTRGELGRARLLRGEWLRRQRRGGEARTELRAARDLLDRIGMGAFAERAARELWATGENGSRVDERRRTDLTPQETQIATLAREGLTNPQIGTRLFISAKTVEYHLSKVFTKLDISARTQLDDVLD